MAKAIVGICRYCGLEKKLCKAHIIPKSFYYNNESEPYKAVIADDFVKRVPEGIYDQNILCEDCDNLFSVYEQHARKVLDYDGIEKYKISNGKDTVFFLKEKEFYYYKLRRFFISLLWKASISTHDAFKKVILGIYENIALKILKGETEGTDSLFKVLILRFSDPLCKGFTMSSKRRLHHDFDYVFVFGGFLIYVIPKAEWASNEEIINFMFLTESEMKVFDVEKNFDGIHKEILQVFESQQEFIKGAKNEQ